MMGGNYQIYDPPRIKKRGSTLDISESPELKKLLEWIIWSADVPDVPAVVENMATMPHGIRPKIDRAFIDANGGPAVVGRVAEETGREVFDDAKIIEIPNKLASVARIHLQYRPWMLNCMAGGMSTRFMEHENPQLVDGLKQFADACHKVGTRPCGVTVLTSKDEATVEGEFNGRTAQEQVLYYAEMLRMAGFTDMVCSPQEAAAIRTDSSFDRLELNCASIRLPDAPVDDQARTKTPAEALLAGVNRGVIGRPITIGVPANNIHAIVENLRTAA